MKLFLLLSSFLFTSIIFGQEVDAEINPKEAEQLSEFGKIEADFSKHLKAREYLEAEKLALDFLEDHPKDGVGHRKLGFFYTLLVDKPALGAIHLEKSWNLTKEPKALEGLLFALVRANDKDGVLERAKLFADNFEKLGKAQKAIFPLAGLAKDEKLFKMAISKVSARQIREDDQLAREIARAAKAIFQD